MRIVRVYHISSRLNRQSIVGRGLLPFGFTDVECGWKGFKYAPRIFVSLKKADPYAMDYVAYENIDVWTFLADKKELVKDTVSGNPYHFYLSRPVPPQRLRLIESF
jgi:hypothetical protein